jgi:hypothetical protein
MEGFQQVPEAQGTPPAQTQQLAMFCTQETASTFCTKNFVLYYMWFNPTHLKIFSGLGLLYLDFGSTLAIRDSWAK